MQISTKQKEIKELKYKIDQTTNINDKINLLKDLVSELGYDQHEEALLYANEALSLSEKIDSKKGKAAALISLGSIYRKHNEFEKAISLLFKGLSLADSENDQLLVANAYINIGLAYSKNHNFNKSLKWYEKAIVACREVNALKGVCSVNNNIALIFHEKGELHKALEKHIENSKLCEEIHFKEGLSTSYNNIGLIYSELGEYQNALDFFNRSLMIKYEFGTQRSIAVTYQNIGTTYLNLKDFPKAKEYLNLCVQQAAVIKDDELLYSIYKDLSNLYKEENNLSEALSFYVKYAELKEKVSQDRRSRRIADLEMRFETKKKEAEIELLNKEKELQALQLKTQFQSMLLRKNLELEGQNKKLNQAILELERFAYITSHDLKEPLRNINSFLCLIEKKIKQRDYGNLEEYIGYSLKGAKQMSALIKGILLYSKLGAEPEIELIDINEVIEKVTVSLAPWVVNRSAKIEFSSLPKLEANPTQMIQLFQNLIENGLNYNNSEQPIIQISSKQTKTAFIFEIKDNGIGIDEQYYDTIFEMFKRLHGQEIYMGAGIGLAICKKIIDAHQGEIWLKGNEDGGTSFFIKLPKNLTSLKQDVQGDHSAELQ